MKESENSSVKKSGNKKEHSDSNDKDKEKKMSFVDHLEELRHRLFWCIGTVVLLAIIAYIFDDQLLQFVMWPKPDGTTLITLAPTQMFIVRLKLAFFTGIIAGIPVLIYQFWKFVAPGLFPKERRIMFPIIFFTLVCFITGGLFAFFVVVKNGLLFLQSFQTEGIQDSWSIEKYISFVVMMIMVFGVVFEIPLVSVFLAKWGVINYKMMRKYRRYAVLSAVILGAVLTPPDGFTQIALAIPLWILYEISIWLVKYFGKEPEEI